MSKERQPLAEVNGEELTFEEIVVRYGERVAVDLRTAQERRIALEEFEKPPKGRVKGRARADAQKMLIVERILDAWRRTPELRLGQLLTNATIYELKAESGASLFYVEDEPLALAAERFAERSKR